MLCVPARQGKFCRIRNQRLNAGPSAAIFSCPTAFRSATMAPNFQQRCAMFKLDDRDIRILSILQKEGRISKSDLAKRVNLSNTPCWERLQRMEKAGIIAGYGAEIALEKLAEHIVVFVTAELENHRAADFALFETVITDEPEITACWAVGGGFDYIFQVVTRNINSYQRLMDRLLDRKIGFIRYFTYVVTKEVKADTGPALKFLVGHHADAAD
jgi:Lrp/AsnC family transcriptional regulator of ectoine degradation